MGYNMAQKFNRSNNLHLDRPKSGLSLGGPAEPGTCQKLKCFLGMNAKQKRASFFTAHKKKQKRIKVYTLSSHSYIGT